MSARLISFIPAETSTPAAPRFEAPEVLPFFTRTALARREWNRTAEAYTAWLHRQRDPNAPREDPPTGDIMLATLVERSAKLMATSSVCNTVTRRPAPHPLWRIACAGGRAVDRALNGLRMVLLVYYALLGLTAFPLFERGQWFGGIAMTMVGSVFAALALTRWRRCESSHPRA